MVTQAPKRSAVFAALAFVLSCVGLTIFVWTQFGGTIPFSAQGYRVSALFKETGLLVQNSDVRISGVNVGKVAAISNRGVYSFVTLDIQRQYAPIPADTDAILRQKTLLGEAYVELSTGNRAGPKLADGATLPRSQVEDTQQLDQVLGTFDKPTQQNLQALLNGTYTSLAGQGENVSDAIGNLDPAVTELTAVVGALNQQQANVQGLISNGATVLTTLGEHSADLQSLITAGDQVFSATAARDAALTRTVDAMPPFLAQLRTTLGTLGTTLALAKPSLDQLRPVAMLLTPALSSLIQLSGPAVTLLRQAPSLLDAATSALPSITRFTAAFHPAVDALLPATRELAPVISFIGLYNRELVAAMANLAAAMEATAPAATPAGTAHYLRAATAIGNESVFGQSVREPTNRTDAYFAPGELSNIGNGGLLSANCNNLHNVSQVPISFKNVRCRVQPSFNWSDGIPPAYFPHLTRAPLPR